MKLGNLIYWITTALLSVWMLLQAYMFIFSSDEAGLMFTSIGAPTALVIPLGIAKLLAVIAILTKQSKLLKRLAYYGLFIDFIAAIVLHLLAGDGNWPMATIALVIAALSFFYDKKLFA